MDVKEPFNNYCKKVTTVALYGHEEPVLFNGRLILREYHKDTKKKEIDVQRTQEYALDTIFYETNKVIRSNMREPYGEPRDLEIRHLAMLKDPYRIVYNKKADPSLSIDNRLLVLLDVDPNARGLALIMKEAKDGTLECLEEQEARGIVSVLTSML